MSVLVVDAGGGVETRDRFWQLSLWVVAGDGIGDVACRFSVSQAMAASQ